MEAPFASRSRLVAFWGLPLAALALAAIAAILIWSKGDVFGVPSRDARISAMLWIGAALVAIVLIHFLAFVLGAYEAAGRVFRREVGDRPQTARPLKRDARLQYLRDELRASRGWLWRYRTPWLMVSGTDSLVEEVAPGLKRAAVMHVGDAILVHATPDGIDATQWRRQIRQLRRRRPVDHLVQVVRPDAGQRSDGELPRVLATIAQDSGWAAPVTFLHAVPAEGNPPETFDAIGVFTGLARAGATQAAVLRDQLGIIETHTAYAGVQLCAAPMHITYLAQVSAYIGEQGERIVAGWEALLSSHWLRAPLAGVMFAPVFAAPDASPTPVPVAAESTATGQAVAGLSGPDTNAALRPQPSALQPAWQAIASRRGMGKRVGFYWHNAISALVIVAAMAWCVLMTVSFIGNQQLMRNAHETANVALDARPQTGSAWRAQLVLQQLIGTLEYRQQHGAPWYLRAGLSRNDAVLAALWQPYRIVAERNLLRPVVGSLESLLKNASAVRADALESEDARQSNYRMLKTYLMLAQPQRAEPAFLAHMLATSWPRPPDLSEGERDDTGRRLAGFYSDHLMAHPEWRITPQDSLVASARNTLVTQIGLSNADDTVYQSILDDVKGKYADASLETLLNGTDSRGLFTTSQTVPGVYTRAAWDSMVAQAIDHAVSERRVSGDWVLTGAQPAQSVSNTLVQGAIRTGAALDEKHAADAFRQRLTARYFASYTAAWQAMLNSIQWQPASNLNGAIDQLTRLGDAQTSPLIALMNSVQYQAQAGRPSQALTDTLVRKAQSLIGNDDGAQTPQVDPLDKPFGPLLALTGDSGPAAAVNGSKAGGGASVTLNNVSLSHYLTAATTMRLKLQQIEASPDAQAMARSLAQAVFQGKLSELSQARDDAALTAASLGTQWAGMGDALFTRPLETAWQTILQPAAASLNEAWQASVAAPFNASMSGRYPFFDTSADASFAELGRYVRPDTGLLARFIATQLAGVLKLQGDQWVPNELAPQALQFDPAFLRSIRQLSVLGAQLYAQGDASYRFEMMSLPTPNVTRSELSVDGRQIVYFNQQESWTPFAWPGNGLNGHAGLTWQTVNAGLRQAFDSPGDWAFLRLVAKADVKQLDSTRYQLTWNETSGEPLRFVLRSQVGAGPLDLLKLRGFRMPAQIFVVGKAGVMPALPPLPPELQP